MLTEVFGNSRDLMFASYSTNRSQIFEQSIFIPEVGSFWYACFTYIFVPVLN